MLSFDIGKEGGLNVLCLGAHCDDIEIGCGGTILRLCQEGKVNQLKWVVFTSTKEREAEARAGAGAFLANLKDPQIIIKDFEDGYLPHNAGDVKKYFEEIKQDFQPDIIFTHYKNDLHQDHRFLCELTWNTFRNHLILEYEIPKYDGDLGNPGFFVILDKETVDQKVKYIENSYVSQSKKHWFDQELFYGLMRIRGMAAASKSKYAEAFYVQKSVYN